ncbi:2-dehydro-3-deoxygluconokinase [Actinomadura verrucosospora]|uniref:2-dehydro-3-deoxygluconokinase n=1 Tax=Actinomadura verrucosospora TaxID=46165 RepID=A0A7D3ZJU8_ACTVE|nr:2-dehydro-3-deoxygluconokinase [Actinomadura verrucosospora]
MLPVNVSRVALIGECMIELRHLAPDRLALGYAGDVFNTAAYLARSAAPGALDVQFVTITGDDPYSAEMRATWHAHGVGDRYARVRPGGRAGLYLIRTDEHGERTFQHYRSESPARDLFGPDQPASVDEAIAGHDLVYLSGITLSIMTEAARARLAEVLAETRRRGGLVAYDGNHRPSGWPSPGAASGAAAAVLAHTSIALPSLDDDRLVHGDASARACVDRLRDAGVPEIVVKLGAEGCVIADRDAMEAVPAVPDVHVVDTTSAGDAFNGAYLAARLAGEGRRAAAEAGARLAAEVIGAPGALLPPLPGRRPGP